MSASQALSAPPLLPCYNPHTCDAARIIAPENTGKDIILIIFQFPSLLVIILNKLNNKVKNAQTETPINPNIIGDQVMLPELK